MERRDFLKTTAGAGFMLAGSNTLASDGNYSRSNNNKMIIDCHMHIGRGERLGDVFQIDCTPERAEALLIRAGIDRAVIFPVAYEDYRQPNREIMDKVRELKIPVLAHCGMGLAPIQYEGVAQSYPDVTLILAHLGFDQNWSNMFSYPQQANCLARKYKNVYLDTSAATWIQHTLEQAVAEVGADKLIFGSDGPWFSPSIMLACLRELDLPERDMRKILYENIAKILKL